MSDQGEFDKQGHFKTGVGTEHLIVGAQQELAEARAQIKDAYELAYSVARHDMEVQLAEARAQIAAKDAALQWDRKRACKAAEVASLRFQQWIPQQWMDFFMQAYEAGDER